jgi:hypothetical protein
MAKELHHSGNQERAYRYRKLSLIYCAYDPVYRYMNDPFVEHPSESVFHRAYYLASFAFGTASLPDGLSAGIICAALLKLSYELEAIQFGRNVSQMILPHVLMSSKFRIDCERVAMRLRVLSLNEDSETLLNVCWSCQSELPLWHDGLLKGKSWIDNETCVRCNAVWIRSMATFETIGVTPLTLSNEITTADIKTWLVSGVEDTKAQIAVDSVLDLHGLRQLSPSTVIVTDTDVPGFLKPRLLHLVGSGDFTHCNHCGSIFESEEYEFMTLKHGQVCPYCRIPPQTQMS